MHKKTGNKVCWIGGCTALNKPGALPSLDITTLDSVNGWRLDAIDYVAGTRRGKMSPHAARETRIWQRQEPRQRQDNITLALALVCLSICILRTTVLLLNSHHRPRPNRREKERKREREKKRRTINAIVESIDTRHHASAAIITRCLQITDRNSSLH